MKMAVTNCKMDEMTIKSVLVIYMALIIMLFVLLIFNLGQEYELWYGEAPDRRPVQWQNEHQDTMGESDFDADLEHQMRYKKAEVFPKSNEDLPWSGTDDDFMDDLEYSETQPLKKPQ